MIVDISLLCIKPESSIRQAMACIDHNDARVALVVNEDSRLVDTITDGDVRRAILANLSLDTPVRMLRGRRVHSQYPEPVTAPLGMDATRLLHLMQDRKIRHLPLVDEQQRVVGIVTLRDLLPTEMLPLRAVVMAGGFGLRMRPLTDELPKPMLPVGEKPLLERIVEQLRETGIRRVVVSTHYKGHVISSHFGDGQEFGVEISYVQEDRPLGTAGSLSLLDTCDDPLLVVNGDVLTRLDFRAMVDFHRDHQADMTVAVCVYELQVPYGVMETDGLRITSVSEKPLLRHFINGGIYLMNPEARSYIPRAEPFDMPDLVALLVREGRRVISFPVHEYWLDIGQPQDYQQALSDLKKGNL